MWEALHNVHDQKNDAARMRLNTLFWYYKVDKGEAIVNGISRLTDIVMRMQNMNESAPESSKIFSLIEGLPPEYLSFSAAWDSTAAGERTFKNLCHRLVCHSCSRK